MHCFSVSIALLLFSFLNIIKYLQMGLKVYFISTGLVDKIRIVSRIERDKTIQNKFL